MLFLLFPFFYISFNEILEIGIGTHYVEKHSDSYPVKCTNR